MIMYSPNGDRIIGTLEKVYGIAAISGVNETSDGFEPEYSGSTEILWDTQTSVMKEGEIIYICDKNKEWKESDLVSG